MDKIRLNNAIPITKLNNWHSSQLMNILDIDISKELLDTTLLLKLKNEDQVFSTWIDSVLDMYVKNPTLPTLDVVLHNALLNDNDRIEEVEKFLHMNFTEKHTIAFLQAHRIWWDKGNKIFSYNFAENKAKYITLYNAWFTKSMIKKCMDYWYVWSIWTDQDPAKDTTQHITTAVFIIWLVCLRICTKEWSIWNDVVADWVQVGWMWSQIVWVWLILRNIINKKSISLSHWMRATLATALWIITEYMQKFQILKGTYDDKDIIAFLLWWIVFYVSLQWSEKILLKKILKNKH